MWGAGLGTPKITSQFARALSASLQDIDYRPADSLEERDAIFSLRYNAYRREGAVAPSSSRRLSDAYDEFENCWIFGVYEDSELVSTIRFHVLTRDCPKGPSVDVFPDKILPLLETGATIIDPTRFAVDPAALVSCPHMAYLTVRVACMASEYFDAKYCLASVREEHRAFYKRMFDFSELAPARYYPPLTKPICLLAGDMRLVRDTVAERYPVFMSTFTERRLLFQKQTANAQPVMMPKVAAIS